MKGPYERLKYDLQRVWECPACKHRERTSGEVTYRICRCQEKEPLGQRVSMRLAEDGVRRNRSAVSPTAARPTAPAPTKEDEPAKDDRPRAAPDTRPGESES